MPWSNPESQTVQKNLSNEDIKFLTEIFRFLSIALLAIGGGTASLMFRERTVWAVAFTAMGLVALVGLAIALYYLQRHIRRLIKEV